MNTPSLKDDVALPAHVMCAQWIDEEDRMWLQEGFANLSPAARARLLLVCFDRASAGVHLMSQAHTELLDGFRDEAPPVTVHEQSCA